ncbi:hypothetical protein JHW43_008595 [Diplocarpon mali]|nr:hypothetical protein JHW43_008595 [Diplocarpon mali]
MMAQHKASHAMLAWSCLPLPLTRYAPPVPTGLDRGGLGRSGCASANLPLGGGRLSPGLVGSGLVGSGLVGSGLVTPAQVTPAPVRWCAVIGEQPVQTGPPSSRARPPAAEDAR